MSALIRQHTAARPKGAIIITEPGQADVEADTLQCAHCQKHWIVQPGSGIERGWCLRCNGPTCGKQACETRCAPWERRLEEMEGRVSLAATMDRMRTL